MERLVSGIVALALTANSTASALQDVGCDFEAMDVGEVAEVVSDVGVIVCEQGGLRVVDAAPSRPEESRALRIPSGESMRVTLELSEAARQCGSLSFRVRREGRRRPFSLLVGVGGGAPRGSVLTLTSRVGADEYEVVDLRLGGAAETVVLEMSSGGGKGLLLDDIVARRPSPMELVDVRVEQHVRPLLLGEYVDIARVTIVTRGDQDPLEMTAFEVSAPGVTEGVMVTGIKLRDAATGNGGGMVSEAENQRMAPGERAGTSLSMELPLGRSEYVAAIRLDVDRDGDAVSAVGVEVPIEVSVRVEDRAKIVGVPRALSRTAVRVGALEGGGGTLPSIAYATRLDSDSPWQVVVSEDPTDGRAFVVHRSVDGGLTWAKSPLRPDLGPGRILRPTIVHERTKGRLLVLFGWRPLGVPPFGEGVGLDETPQLMLVESLDQGLTWSDPRNLTESVKAVEWSRIRPAGGRGIRTSGGKLAVPMLVTRRENGVEQQCFAALLSADGGATWTATPLGPAGTMWPALAELGDGVLAMNAATRRGERRIAMTLHEGDAHWRTLTRSGSDRLPCAGGAGALIHVGREAGSSMDGRLIFANASVSKKPPQDLTLRGSNDNGTRWRDGKALLLDDGRAVGAPALGLVTRDAVGVLYRSSGGAVVFQRLPLDEVVDPVATFGQSFGGR